MPISLHHYQVLLTGQIPLTLTYHPSLLGISLGIHILIFYFFYSLSWYVPLDGSQCQYRADGCKFLLVGQHLCILVLESIGDTSFMSLFLLQQYLTCLAWMVYGIGSKWPYSCCFFKVLLPGFVSNSMQAFLCRYDLAFSETIP